MFAQIVVPFEVMSDAVALGVTVTVTALPVFVKFSHFSVPLTVT